MEDTLEREIAQAIRKNYVLALVMMDIDNFKEINDKYGHMAGDMVISRIAAMLKESVHKVMLFAALVAMNISLSFRNAP
jgi:diguanylate cyclase (GGDEF)-like protein